MGKYGKTLCEYKPSPAKRVKAPDFRMTETFDLTSACLKQQFRTSGDLEKYSVFHKNGIFQIGPGNDMRESFANFIPAEDLKNKLINANILFLCRSELGEFCRLHSEGRIFIATTDKKLPYVDGYFIEYEDNGAFGFKIGKRKGKDITYLCDKVVLEGEYKPYDFVNVKFGAFYEKKGLRIVVYYNKKPIINVFDGEKPAGLKSCLYFENGLNRLYLRGIGSRAKLNIKHPVEVGQFKDIKLYDFSQLDDYSFRDLHTMLTPRRFCDNNGITIPYRLYLPKDYDPKKKYPLMMYLHGAGLKGDDNIHQLGYDRNFYKSFLDIQAKQEMIFVIPQCNVKSWNDGDYDINKLFSERIFKLTDDEPPMVEAIMHLFYDLEETFSVDHKRIYLSGASMGGMGAYGVLGRHPEYFAAGFIGCAMGDPGKAKEYAKVPLWIGHGTLDPAISVSKGREMAKAIEEAGGEVNYNEYPDRYHDFSTREDFDKAMEWVITKSK